MYIVYILLSESAHRHYIGQTSDLAERIKRHNAGRVRSTAPYKPWRTIYTEHFNTIAEALRREREIKSFKGGIKFKKFLGLWND